MAICGLVMLERYPDYWTQGETQEELRDIYGELTGGHIP